MIRLSLMLLAMMCGTATAQDYGRMSPVYPYSGGPVPREYRTVWDWQPEYRPCYGWDCYGRQYQLSYPCFTGRVTWQPQERVYQTFTRNGVIYSGWSDANRGLFRNVGY